MAASAWMAVGVLLLPVAAGSWTLPGSEEPDTDLDRKDSFMWPGPDGGADGLWVYFHVLPAQALHAARGYTNAGAGVVGGVNPNLLPGGRGVPLVVHPLAYLGVWKDCNGDGAVGMAEGALWRYSALLLEGDTPCPQDSPFRPGTTVTEFLHLGYPSGPHAIGGVFYDDASRVWGDVGRPGERPPTVCTDLPMPRGTTRGTGGLLTYADCFLGRALDEAVGAVDPDGKKGLRFAEPGSPGGRCGSLLVHDSRLHHEDRCTGEPALLDRRTGIREADLLLTLAAGADPAPFVEYGGERSPSDVRRHHDFVFSFRPSAGGSQVTALGQANLQFFRDGWILETPPYRTTDRPGWVLRSDLTPTGPLWLTFYARVGAQTLATLQTPAPRPGIYGAEACGGQTSGVRHGWECAADAWWEGGPGGGRPNPTDEVWDPETGSYRPLPLGVAPGAAYHLRDVDCLDGALAAGTPPAGPVLISEEPPC